MANEECSLHYNITKTVHVTFRTLKECGGQPIIKEINKLDEEVSAVPKNLEKHILIYVSIRIIFNYSFKLIDASRVELENNVWPEILEKKLRLKIFFQVYLWIF